jgi:hypothetical protein
MNKLTVPPALFPPAYVNKKEKEVVPWVKIKSRIKKYPTVLMPEQPTGYIKTKKHDFL